MFAGQLLLMIVLRFRYPRAMYRGKLSPIEYIRCWDAVPEVSDEMVFLPQ